VPVNDAPPISSEVTPEIVYGYALGVFVVNVKVIVSPSSMVEGVVDANPTTTGVSCILNPPPNETFTTSIFYPFVLFIKIN
jgi:hypothetical protein